MRSKARTIRFLVLLGLVPCSAFAGDIQTDGALVSKAPAGESPLEVTSPTRVENLNADRLDGLDSAELALHDHTHPELDPPPSAVVSVDCGAGESIGDALEVPAEEIVIEVSGLCEEVVVIRRPGVTLRGTDPSIDGIRPPAGAADYFALVNVLYSSRDRSSPVRFENLSISGGSMHGVEAFASGLEIADCLVEDHASMGIRSDSGAYVEVTDSAVSGNGFWGARARSGGTLWFERTDFIDNPSVGFGGILDSYVVAIDVSVSDSDFPVSIYQSAADLDLVTTTGAVAGASLTSSSVTITRSTLAGSSASLRSFDQGTTKLFDSTLDGSIVALGQSQVYLSDTTQTAPTESGALLENFVEAGSLLQLFGTTTLLGPNILTTLGNLTALGSGPVIDGDLSCSVGADAFCSGSGNLTGTSDCESCPPPAGASSFSHVPEVPRAPSPGIPRIHPR